MSELGAESPVRRHPGDVEVEVVPEAERARADPGERRAARARTRTGGVDQLDVRTGFGEAEGGRGADDSGADDEAAGAQLLSFR